MSACTTRSLPSKSFNLAHQILEYVDRKLTVGMHRYLPAYKPAVEAVDGGREIGLVAIQGELRLSADHEQP